MHIVTAAHDCYPDPGSGGTGRYVYETARRLVDLGHRVSVVTRRRGDVPRRSEVEGVSVYRFDLAVADRPGSSVLAQLPRARREVAGHVETLSADGSPDLLSAQGPVASLLVDRHLDRVPTVATFHSPWPVEYRLRTRTQRTPPRRWLNLALRWCLERRVLSGADGVVTLSRYMRDELRRVYGRDFGATVVPGGVDAERFAPSAAADGRPLGGRPAFLTVRRLAERMGHPLLFDAFASVVSQHPQARLYVAGDGPRRDRLERLAASLGIADRTTFLGYVPDRDLPRLYAAADVFVLPTTALEGFGLATLEALASGTPVVATPVGGTPEVLAGLGRDPAVPVAPLAVEVSADALADRMRSWADRPAETYASAGRAGRRHAVRRYPWERTVSSVESIYERTVGSPSRTPSTSQSRNGATAGWSGSR